VRRPIRIVGVAIAVLTAIALGYGPLFALLPATPGFARLRMGGLVVLRRPTSAVNPAERRLPDAARDASTAVGLSFTGDVPIVVCDSWSDLRRFTPWLPVNPGLGARTLPIGHIIYVTPLIKDRPDMDIFVRHELIHVLLHQHMPLSDRLDGGRPAWLIEGVATYFGNPDSYPASGVLRHRIAPEDIPRVIREGPGVAGATMFYGLSRDVVASLEKRGGRDNLRAFLKAYTAMPRDWQSSFVKYFGQTFDAFLAGFATGTVTP